MSPRPAERTIDAVPAFTVAVWFWLRVGTGSVLPIEQELVWQISAIVPALAASLSAIKPSNLRFRLITGISSVVWLGAWSVMFVYALAYDTTLGRAVSWIGMWQYFMMAVLIAYQFGRRPHPTRWEDVVS